MIVEHVVPEGWPADTDEAGRAQPSHVAGMQHAVTLTPEDVDLLQASAVEEWLPDIQGVDVTVLESGVKRLWGGGRRFFVRAAVNAPPAGDANVDIVLDPALDGQIVRRHFSFGFANSISGAAVSTINDTGAMNAGAIKFQTILTPGQIFTAYWDVGF